MPTLFTCRSMIFLSSSCSRRHIGGPSADTFFRGRGTSCKFGTTECTPNGKSFLGAMVSYNSTCYSRPRRRVDARVILVYLVALLGGVSLNSQSSGILPWAVTRKMPRLFAIEAKSFLQVLASFFIGHGIDSSSDSIDIHGIWVFVRSHLCVVPRVLIFFLD